MLAHMIFCYRCVVGLVIVLNMKIYGGVYADTSKFALDSTINNHNIVAFNRFFDKIKVLPGAFESVEGERYMAQQVSKLDVAEFIKNLKISYHNKKFETKGLSEYIESSDIFPYWDVVIATGSADATKEFKDSVSLPVNFKVPTRKFVIEDGLLKVGGANNRILDPGIFDAGLSLTQEEKDKFKEAAEDTFGERISEKDIESYVTAVALLCSPACNKDKYKEHLAEAVKENKALFTSLRRKRNPNDVDEERGSIISLTPFQCGKLAKLIHIIEKIENMKVKRNHGIPVTGRLLITAMTAINKPGKNTIWLDTDENGVLSLCSTPKNIDTILYTTVWNRNTSHVLTSGTMSDGTDFEYFKEENGLEQIPRRLLLESRTESPFDYANHTRLYIPKGMPTPDNTSEEYFKAIADQVYEIIKATHGHTAILFTSYKTLHLVHVLLKDKLDEYDIICMTRSNKNAIADFKKSKNGILFASGSMWEGVDCVGDCLSSVIIVRLPFPMRSALMEEKKDCCYDVGEFVNKYCTPNMLIKLRQGVVFVIG